VPSGDGPGQPFPAISSPQKAYDTWFANLAQPATGGMSGDRLLAQERSVLDFMKADVGRMSARLAAPEKARLGQYLDGLRAVERQLGQLESVSAAGCQPPAKPTGTDMQATLAAYIDVVFAAQMCNLTRVSHVSFWGVDGPQMNFPWLNLPTNEHDTHHMLESQSNMGILSPPIQRMDAYILSKVAQMIGNLAKTPEGGGTMLDNALLLYVNAGGGKHHKGHNNHAVILAGRAGGGLRTGRYLTYPLMQHAISDLYVSLANLLGSPITTFGDPALCKGPLTALA